MRKTNVKLKDINCVEMLRFQFFILQMLCGMQSVSIRQSQIKQNWTACIYIYLVISKHIPPLIPRCSWEITFWQKKAQKVWPYTEAVPEMVERTNIAFLADFQEHTLSSLFNYLKLRRRYATSTRTLWTEIVASHNYTCENIVWFDFLWFASKNKNSILLTMMYNCCFLLSFLFFFFAALLSEAPSLFLTIVINLMTYEHHKMARICHFMNRKVVELSAVTLHYICLKCLRNFTNINTVGKGWSEKK